MPLKRLSRLYDVAKNLSLLLGDAAETKKGSIRELHLIAVGNMES